MYSHLLVHSLCASRPTYRILRRHKFFVGANRQSQTQAYGQAIILASLGATSREKVRPVLRSFLAPISHAGYPTKSDNWNKCSPYNAKKG